jgi:Spy/CpxP family protein refolding chaperone
MSISRFTSLLAAALIVAACDRGPTQPSSTALLDSLDPSAVSFNATIGLPGQPFQDDNVQHAPANAKAPGAPFPDSLKLTAAQKAAIQALVNAYATASAADLAALNAIHAQLAAAIKAGDTKAQVQAIVATAAPILARLQAAATDLRSAIDGVLTPAQKAWISSHMPSGPPPGWQPPLPHGP